MITRRIHTPLLICLLLQLAGCGGSELKFPMEKRYWDPEDYRDAIINIRWKTPEGQQRPRFSDPETSPVFKKLSDPTNYEVVLTDPELGLNHKAEVAQKFFEEYRNLVELYGGMDRQDLYVYPEELIAVENFGLGLQLHYFKLGNDRIKQQSDKPDDLSTLNIIQSNEQTILKNFNNYLDNINEEKSFSTFAPQLADGINTHFTRLPEMFPDADFSITINKAELMLEKAQGKEIKEALTNLIAKLKSLKKADSAS
jgi:hypothetical protein